MKKTSIPLPSWLNRYRAFMFLQIVVVMLVFAFFKWIDDRKLASVAAGFLFVVSSAVIFSLELRNKKRSFSLYASAIFLVISAIPIFFMRLRFWSEPFESLAWMGFSARNWHEISNYLFMLLLMALFADSYLTNRREAEAAK